MRSWTKTTAIGLVACLALVVSACGGGGDKAEVVASEDEGTQTTEERRSSDTAGDLSEDLEQTREDLEDLGMGELGECMEIGVAYMAVSLGALGAMFGADQAEMQELEDQLADLEGKLPAEIEDDFQVLADAYAEFAEGTAGLSGDLMDPGYQEQLEQAGKALESDEVAEAQANIEAYLQDECPDYAGAAQ